MSDSPLVERLVLAAVEARRDGDPRMLIAIGTNEVQITWPDGPEFTAKHADRTSRQSDLRDRIAAVISDELFKRDAYTEYGTDEPGDWARVDGHINVTALADAVIRELRYEALYGGMHADWEAE